MATQPTFAAGNIGGIGTNGSNGLNNGIGTCTATSIGLPQPQQQMPINDMNEQFDHNGYVDITMGTMLINGGPEKYSYSPGGWENANVELSDEFKQHYEEWLQEEVFSIHIDWDLLKTTYDIEPTTSAESASKSSAAGATTTEFPCSTN